MPAESAEKLQRYDLLERIATGGMGEVFRARIQGEHGFNKTVAVKRILPMLARDSSFVVRFVSEAKLAVSLTHANVVQVLDLGRAGEDLFLVMEYVEGSDLTHALAAVQAQKKQVSVGVALHIASEALKALAYSHERGGVHPSRRGIIHCDISPSNLLLSYAGEVKVTDFGIAQVVDEVRRRNPGQRPMGKARYMSPEQINGEPVDPTTDLYALALVLYEMLTLQPAFPGIEPEAIMLSVLENQVPSVTATRPDVPRALENLIARATSKTRGGRPASAREMLAEMTEIARSVTPAVTAPDVGLWLQELLPPVSTESGSSFDGALRVLIPPGAAGRRTGTVPPVVPSIVTLHATGQRNEDGTMVWESDNNENPGRSWVWKTLGALASAAAAAGVAWALNFHLPYPTPKAAAAPAALERSSADVAVHAPEPTLPVPAPPPPTPAPVADVTEPAALPVHDPPAHTAQRHHGTGFVNIYTEPWASAFVDGKRVGTTPLMNLSLKEGRHHLMLQTAAGARKETVLNVVAGQTQLVNLDLPGGPPR